MSDEIALNLQWAYGVSPVRNGVVNLSDATSDRVFYTSSHTAVIQCGTGLALEGAGEGVVQDLRDNVQTVLQGHTQPITCVCTSDDKSLVVTGDVGPDSLLIVWNTVTSQPHASVAKPHPNGTLAMDLSTDGTLLVTLSSPESLGGVQEISLWDLSSHGSLKSTITIPIPAGDLQTMCKFHSSDPTEIISNGVKRVYFWLSCLPAQAMLKYYSPPLSSADFKQKIGDFTVSAFIPGTTQAVTGTDGGDVVVWDEQGISAEVGTKATDRKAVKLMRVHSTPLTMLATIGDFLVTGGEDGFVRFFDPMLRLIAWFEQMDVGEVTSVSFSRAPITAPAGDAEDLDVFLCPDFVVGTRQSKIVAMDANAFNEHTSQRRAGTMLVEGMIRSISQCCCHPMLPEFLVSGPDGRVQLWDTVSHALLRSHTLPDGLIPTAVTYSRDGELLLAGTSNGTALILSSRDLSEVIRFKNSRAAITHVAFSAKGKHIACGTADGYIMLMFLVPYRSIHRWEYIGRNKVHYSPIVCVHFGEAPSGGTRCFSVSEDGRMGEYDLQASSLQTGVIMCNELTVCAGSAPTAMCFTPPLTYYEEGVVDTQIILSDASFKIRIFNPDSAVTIGTFRGPTYGGPLVQLTIFQSVSSDRTFVAFRSKEKTAGVMLWPMDGDPAKMMGMIAHPNLIAGMSVSFDGRKLITAGSDGIVNQWDLNTSVLERAAVAAEKATDRWDEVIGSDAVLNDIKRYFVFAQVRAQGEDATLPRHIPGRVPLDHIPELMCALGYYPTQSEIHDMLSNLAFMAAVRKQPKPEDIDLQTFLYLYHNFKPVSGVTMDEIEKAFATLGGNRKTKALSRARFQEAVTTLGEVMDLEELGEAIRLLTGQSALAKAMPSELAPVFFATDILGLDSEA